MPALVILLLFTLAPSLSFASDATQSCEPYLFSNPLSTPRLLIRSLRLADLPAVREIYKVTPSDPRAMSVSDLELLSKIVRSGFAAQDDWQILDWGVALKTTGQLIGVVQVYDRRNDGSAQIGYHFHPEFWGQGYATEALTPLVKYLFNVIKLNAIRAEVHPTNYASQKVLMKLDFDCLGLFRSDFHTRYDQPLMHFIWRPSFWQLRRRSRP